MAVRTADLGGEHGVLFNRAAASQAFSRRFPGIAEAIETARKELRAPTAARRGTRVAEGRIGADRPFPGALWTPPGHST